MTEDFIEESWRVNADAVARDIKVVCNALGGEFKRERLGRMIERISCILPRPVDAGILIRNAGVAREIRGRLGNTYLYIHETDGDPLRLISFSVDGVFVDVAKREWGWSARITKPIREFGIRLKEFNMEAFFK